MLKPLSCCLIIVPDDEELARTEAVNSKNTFYGAVLSSKDAHQLNFHIETQ